MTETIFTELITSSPEKVMAVNQSPPQQRSPGIVSSPASLPQSKPNTVTVKLEEGSVQPGFKEDPPIRDTCNKCQPYIQRLRADLQECKLTQDALESELRWAMEGKLKAEMALAEQLTSTSDMHHQPATPQQIREAFINSMPLPDALSFGITGAWQPANDSRIGQHNSIMNGGFPGSRLAPIGSERESIPHGQPQQETSLEVIKKQQKVVELEGCIQRMSVQFQSLAENYNTMAGRLQQAQGELYDLRKENLEIKASNVDLARACRIRDRRLQKLLQDRPAGMQDHGPGNAHTSTPMELQPAGDMRIMAGEMPRVHNEAEDLIQQALSQARNQQDIQQFQQRQQQEEEHRHQYHQQMLDVHHQYEDRDDCAFQHLSIQSDQQQQKQFPYQQRQQPHPQDRTQRKTERSQKIKPQLEDDTYLGTIYGSPGQGDRTQNQRPSQVAGRQTETGGHSSMKDSQDEGIPSGVKRSLQPCSGNKHDMTLKLKHQGPPIGASPDKYQPDGHHNKENNGAIVPAKSKDSKILARLGKMDSPDASKLSSPSKAGRDAGQSFNNGTDMIAHEGTALLPGVGVRPPPVYPKSLSIRASRQGGGGGGGGAAGTPGGGGHLNGHGQMQPAMRKRAMSPEGLGMGHHGGRSPGQAMVRPSRQRLNPAAPQFEEEDYRRFELEGIPEEHWLAFSQGTYKTELCNKWEQTGSCPYGNRCQFAHGVDEMRPVLRHPRYKTELCRMVASGQKCPYGHRCHFRHALSPEEQAAMY